MTDTSLVTPVTTDPLLRWGSIAEHAWAAHGARWASDHEAITAIIETSDSQPVTGSRGWGDVQMLACTAAALATTPPACDLEALHQTENLAA